MTVPTEGGGQGLRKLSNRPAAAVSAESPLGAT